MPQSIANLYSLYYSTLKKLYFLYSFISAKIILYAYIFITVLYNSFHV